MMRKTWSVAAVLLLVAAAQAEPRHGHRLGRWADCPPSLYSPLHYWAPTLIRVRDCLHQPTVSSYGEIRPDITPSYQIIRYPCPAVDPAAIPYGVPLQAIPVAPMAPPAPPPY
jgi:hypothetical protein